MDGVQFGVVNAARAPRAGCASASSTRRGATRGFSFGVINVAKHEDGESFALINVVGNGIHDVSLFATDVLATNIGFKLGGRHLYTNLMAGYQPGDALAAGPERFSAGTQALRHRRRHRLALPRRARPARVRRARSGLDGDPSGLELDQERARRGVAARAGGPAAGAATSCCWPAPASTSRSRRAAATSTWAWTSPQSVQHSGDTTVRIYPGLLLGLQI